MFRLVATKSFTFEFVQTCASEIQKSELRCVSAQNAFESLTRKPSSTFHRLKEHATEEATTRLRDRAREIGNVNAVSETVEDQIMKLSLSVLAPRNVRSQHPKASKELLSRLKNYAQFFWEGGTAGRSDLEGKGVPTLSSVLEEVFQSVVSNSNDAVSGQLQSVCDLDFSERVVILAEFRDSALRLLNSDLLFNALHVGLSRVERAAEELWPNDKSERDEGALDESERDEEALDTQSVWLSDFVRKF